MLFYSMLGFALAQIVIANTNSPTDANARFNISATHNRAGIAGPRRSPGLVGPAGPIGKRDPVGQYGPPAICNGIEVEEIVVKKLHEIIPWAFVEDCTKVDARLLNKSWYTGGIFVISSWNKAPTEVYCDLATDGGGWTVFQRRMDGSVNFTRNWSDYVTGFGTLDEEYWMGLEKLHRLTSDGNYELRVDMRDWREYPAHAKYSKFSVAGSSERYRLRVGGYSGNAGDSLSLDHDDQYFSALDQDNDRNVGSCSKAFKGGWWFCYCYGAHLNGIYHDQEIGNPCPGQGIIWYTWKGEDYSLKFTEMKFRRKK